MNDFERLPAHIKRYLINWRCEHLEEYSKLCGRRSLGDLTKSELHGFFSYATQKDLSLKFWIN